MPGTEALKWGIMSAHIMYQRREDIRKAVERGEVSKQNLEVQHLKNMFDSTEYFNHAHN
jgi:hypothetical protein